MENNIRHVVEDRVCTGCGTCSAVCPNGVISMNLDESYGTFRPVLNNIQFCYACGLCKMCCPPLTWSNHQISALWKPHIGDYQKAYVIHATDDELRFSAASGGFITALLLYLLRNKLITCAVVTRRKPNAPFFGEPFLATSEEEILSAKGSKYMPISFDEILKLLLNKDLTDHRIAYVGLPCHIEGLSRASEQFKVLRESIKYKIGIVCGRTPSLLAYDYILKRLDVNKSQVAQIINRGDGWPGFMTIFLKDGSIKKIHHTDDLSWGMVFSSPIFTPIGCELCVDPGGYCSDIMVSDAWLKRFKDDKKGVSAVLLKSDKMVDIVLDMNKSNLIKIFDSSADEFISANHGVMKQKLTNTQIALPLLLGKKSKKYGQNVVFASKINLLNKLKLFIFYIHIRMIKSINLNELTMFLNRPILFYLKLLKLLKR